MTPPVYVLQFNGMVTDVFSTEDLAMVHFMESGIRKEHSRHGRWILTEFLINAHQSRPRYKVLDSGESAEISAEWETEPEGEKP